VRGEARWLAAVSGKSDPWDSLGKALAEKEFFRRSARGREREFLCLGVVEGEGRRA